MKTNISKKTIFVLVLLFSFAVIPQQALAFSLFNYDKKLVKAVKSNDLKKAAKYIKKGADVDVKNDKGEPVLYYAATKGNIKMLKLLIKHGVDVDARTTSGTNALLRSVIKGKMAVVRLLLESSADIEAKSHSGLTPFQMACNLGHVDIAKLLLEKGANDTIEDSENTICGDL